jgi:hypothetical protein
MRASLAATRAWGIVATNLRAARSLGSAAIALNE